MTGSPTEAGDALTSDARSASNSTALDVLFDALADRRRRHALRCLDERQTPITLADLAEEVARREREVPIGELSAEAVKRVYMSLYHTHVPKLVEAGVVEYAQERDTVALSSVHERAESLMAVAAPSE